jgi:pimeloyl-ACP methyl ester carboxylesterase
MTTCESADVTLLLVHGACHRAATWAPLLDELPDVHIRTVQLPSSAPVPVAALGGMYDDARTIRAVTETITGPVVVCAHSYGGVATSQAVEGMKQVRRLVFLNSFLLEVGASLLTTFGGSFPPLWDVHEAEGYMEARDAEQFLYNDLPLADARRAAASLGPQSLSSMRQPLTQAAWCTVPTTYVVGERDLAMPPSMTELFASRASSVVRLDTSHSPFLSRPGETAKLLRDELALARRV